MSMPIERFRSDEMADLMDRVQQLLEANVLAMVIRDSRGRISVTCPPSRRDEIVALLQGVDWNAWKP